jgi:glucose/arabinose dehydrogenase
MRTIPVLAPSRIGDDPPRNIRPILPLLATMLIAGCVDGGGPLPASSLGTDPDIPPPRATPIPTVNIAPAKGWSDGERPVAADGLEVHEYAGSLDHPRWLYVLPNGDVLVAETNAPPRPNDATGIKGWIMRMVMKRAGAATPSADRITLLRDTDHDGVVDLRETFIDGLRSPFGMALIDDDFYVANTDAVVKFSYVSSATHITSDATTVADLPAGTINHHWTKNIIASPDGTRLFAAVGSNSNIAENGMEHEHHRAAILEIDPASGGLRLFASGLRNPVGLAWNPQTGELWTTVNERDELGDDVVPDYMTAVRDGAFYGWPYCYFGQHVDERVQPQDPGLVAEAVVPDYSLGAHTASLGLVFYEGDQLPSRYRDGAFVAQHGSWNRSTLSGYKVVFVPFADGRPVGLPEDVLTGFVDDDGNARGRPAGLAVDASGALLVADDVGNKVWRVTARPRNASESSR